MLEIIVHAIRAVITFGMELFAVNRKFQNWNIKLLTLENKAFNYLFL